MLTGESIPKSKNEGDEVFGATINKEGFFKFKATKIGEETVLSQIINLVKEAQSKKAPIQRLADKVVVWFVPIVLIIAVISFVIWHFIENKSVAFSLTSAVAVLIIACPCALGIATPTAIMAGTAIGAEHGILFKGASFLEKTKELTTICFDKTGTLTKGKPEVTDIVNDVLQLAASLANNSTHPLDTAIINEAKKRNIDFLKVENFESIPGMGIKGKINNKEFLLGNRKLIKTDLYQNLEEEGKTIIILSENNSPIGAIAIKDIPKEHSKEAIEELKKMGLEIYLITGDNKKTAQAVAKNLNIDNVIAEVLPQNKEQEIEKLQSHHKIVGAVGDGINDAPMLAKADVGIAMGAGSDIAKETGNIVLVKDDIKDVVKAIKLSKQTLRKIKQNIFFAFIYNIIAIPIAAGILYPFLGFLLKPEIAAIAMILSDITVVSNSLILRKSKL